MIHDDRTPRHIPHQAGTDMLAMGLRPLDPAQWIEVDNSLPRYHRHTRSMREQHGDAVYAALPSSLQAQRELCALLCSHLVEHHGDAYRRSGDGVTSAVGGFHVPVPADDPEPLWSASLLVADDLAIMQPGANGYLLVAASLATPSHWRLQDKLGRPMRAIHDPIPGIHDQLTPRIERFFDHITPQRPVCRFNWGMQADPALYQPGTKKARIPANAQLFYRVERQTLRRLPDSGCVVFTIRVFLHPLETLSTTPGAIADLVAAVDATPPALSAYKGFPALRDALEQYRIEFTTDANL